MATSNSTAVQETEHTPSNLWKLTEEALNVHPKNTNALIDHRTIDTMEHAGQVLALLGDIDLDELSEKARAGYVYVMSAVQEALAFELEHREDIETAQPGAKAVVELAAGSETAEEPLDRGTVMRDTPTADSTDGSKGSGGDGDIKEMSAFIREKANALSLLLGNIDRAFDDLDVPDMTCFHVKALAEAAFPICDDIVGAAAALQRDGDDEGLPA